MNHVLAKGAEALIFKKSNYLIKNRIKKSYRIPILDQKLRKQRTKKEVKLLDKANKIIPVPKIIKSDEFQISLEFIKGKKLSKYLDAMKNNAIVCKEIGENIAKLHDSNIIHGDLTTSNMIYSKHKVVFIDFGLGFESSRIEDKAVDLHLIKQALEAKHFKYFDSFFKAIKTGYEISKNSALVVKQLEKVESRGRYKTQY